MLNETKFDALSIILLKGISNDNHEEWRLWSIFNKQIEKSKILRGFFSSKKKKRFFLHRFPQLLTTLQKEDSIFFKNFDALRLLSL